MSGTKIYEAVSSMLSEVEAIAKNRKNQQQNYNFRGIDDVYNAVHPLFAKYRVFPTCEIASREVTERETKSGGVLFYVNMKAKYTLFAEDGSSVVTEAWGEAMDSGDKATNKAMSNAYKYALFQLLCIPTEMLADTEQDTPEPAPRRTDLKPAKKITPPPGMTTGDKIKPPAKAKKPFDEVLAATEGFDPLKNLLSLIDKKDDADLPTKAPMYAATYRKLLALDFQPEQASWMNDSLQAKRAATLLDDVTFTELITKVDAILDRAAAAA